ncbi:hypothetical protein [Flavobacterium sp.]|uniref:hypothetical protein n=1 Tax=Flavobacterium sp. TaxID=239 RepID=UPI0026396FD4|nr:hypothetical protein [Flavobacterium sp.]
MTQIKSFKDFGIKAEIKAFTGEKIKVKKILNAEIVVIDFEIKDSKFDGQCLYIQIKKGDVNHVIFTGSKYLIQVIQLIPKENFPFKATIVENDERYEFT